MKKIEEFLEWLKSSSDSEITNNIYRANLKQFYDIMNINDDNLDSFNTKEFLTYVKELKKNYAPTSINQKIGTLKSFYKYLYKSGYLQDTRYLSFKSLIIGKKLPQFLEIEDAKKLIDTVRNLDTTSQKVRGKLKLRDRLIIEILLDTGVRGIELENMKISDIDFKTGETFVLGKGNIQRYVKISDSTLKLIKEWLKVRKELNIREGFEDYLIISSTNGENLKKRRIQYIIKKYIGVSNIENVSMHKIRHTYASIMISTGTLTVEEVRDRLGHKNITTTMDYIHALKNEQKDNPLFA